MILLGKISAAILLAVSPLIALFSAPAHQSAAVAQSVATSTATSTLAVASSTDAAVAAPADMFTRDLYYGLSHDADVQTLQNFLSAEGLYDGTPNGNFLAVTRQAVKAFQIQEGIAPATGFFGSSTRVRANELAGQSAVSMSSANATASTTAPVPVVDLSSAVADLSSTTDALTQGLNDLMSQFNDLQQRVGILAATVDDLGATVSVLQADPSVPDTSAPVSSASAPSSSTVTTTTTATSTATSTPPVNPHLYTIANMSLVYPQDWQMLASAPAGSQAAFQPVSTTSTQMFASTTKTTAAQSEFATQTVTQLTLKYKATTSSSSGVPAVSVPVFNTAGAQTSTVNAIVTNLPYKNGTQQMTVMIVMFVYNGIGYTLQISAPATIWSASLQSTATAIFNTLKLKS